MSRTKLRPQLTLLTVLMTIFCAAPAMASVAGAHSLQIPPGARANGLGQASVALADDATAAWWNPAGLGNLNGKTLGLMHSQLVPDLAEDIYYEYGVWVQKIEGWGTYAISLIYLSYGKSPITVDSPEIVGWFSSYEFAPAISYGVRVTNNLSLGMTMKYVRVDLASSNDIQDLKGDGVGSSVAVDFGSLVYIGPVTIGTVLSNFGPNISFIDEEQSDPMPRHFKLGAAIMPFSSEYGHILATMDASQMLVTGGPFIMNMGVEGQYTDIMALRMGYIHDPDGDITNLTFGGGFHVELSNMDLFLDYASVPQATDLDRVHRFSVELHF